MQKDKGAIYKPGFKQAMKATWRLEAELNKQMPKDRPVILSAQRTQ